MIPNLSDPSPTTLVESYKYGRKPKLWTNRATSNTTRTIGVKIRRQYLSSECPRELDLKESIMRMWFTSRTWHSFIDVTDWTLIFKIDWYKETEPIYSIQTYQREPDEEEPYRTLHKIQIPQTNTTTRGYYQTTSTRLQKSKNRQVDTHRKGNYVIPIASSQMTAV